MAWPHVTRGEPGSKGGQQLTKRKRGRWELHDCIGESTYWYVVADPR